MKIFSQKIVKVPKWGVQGAKRRQNKTGKNGVVFKKASTTTVHRIMYYGGSVPLERFVAYNS